MAIFYTAMAIFCIALTSQGVDMRWNIAYFECLALSAVWLFGVSKTAEDLDTDMMTQ